LDSPATPKSGGWATWHARPGPHLLSRHVPAVRGALLTGFKIEKGTFNLPGRNIENAFIWLDGMEAAGRIASSARTRSAEMRAGEKIRSTVFMLTRNGLQKGRQKGGSRHPVFTFFSLSIFFAL